ncbi:MAG: type I-B CRISPR-associated endonuclease Cas1 [Balneolaceae bacterium]|nr:type I-B CRISPR-associated endonuclease Cas1 [Balneolaceae bacterium]
MKTAIYLFEPVTLKRKDQTLCLEKMPNAKHSHPGSKIARELVEDLKLGEEDAWWRSSPKYIPVERVDAIHAYDSVRLNSALLNFLSQKNIPLHLYNYYGSYSGSYLPKDALPNGNLLMKQCLDWSNEKKALILSKELVLAAAHNMRHNIRYAVARDHVEERWLDRFDHYTEPIHSATDKHQLLGAEGQLRAHYYDFLDRRLQDAFKLRGRSYNPPTNPGNALVSFLNMACYAAIINEMHRTQLNPLIGFYHKPGRHRFPLAYDLAELFKPLLVDRLMISLINRNQLTADHFESEMNGCLMNPEGRYIVVRAFEKTLRTTIHHRGLNRSVSYRRLMRLEGYKLVKELIGEKTYEAFRIWW